MFLLFIMSFSSFLSGRIGVIANPYSFDGSDGSVPIILDPATGTIKGNIATDPTDFNQPNVVPNFQALNLVDANLAPSSTADRLVVQLPNTDDVIKVDYRGAIMRQNATTLQANWILGAPEANNGSSFRINTSEPNLQLYAPDSGGQVALYNTASTQYQWVLSSDGNATFESVVSRANIFCNGSFASNGNCNINGNLLVNGTITGVVQSQSIPVYVNANYTVPNDGNNYELLINANTVGIGAGDLIITLPTDPTHQMEVNMSVVDLGTANSIAVGDGTPQIAFIANGLRTFVDLKLTGLSKTTFKHVSWGVNGDWWTVSPF